LARYPLQSIQTYGISDDALLLFFLFCVSCLNLVSSGSGLLDLVNWASLSMGMIDLRPIYWGGRSLKNTQSRLEYGQHPAIERLCGIVIALVVEQSCQVVEAGTGIGMVWSESLFPDGQRLAKERLCGCCQSNANQSLNIKISRISRRQLTPFGHGRSAVLLECFATVEMTFEVEMIVDRSMN
jgi:hypothetical protein